MFRRPLYIALLLWVCASAFPQQTLRVMSYNVENLFYPEPDSLHDDNEFTPHGARRWSFTRYYRKLAQIGKVVSSAAGWHMPAIVGFQEVEEQRCLRDLCTRFLGTRPYRYVLFEGHDIRGIDVGLIYDTTQLALLSARALPVPLPGNERPTRDILYTRFLLLDSTCLHVFTCHLPSQLGGKTASEPRRQAAYKVLSAHTDSLLTLDSTACILVMGDFNTAPRDVLPPLTNLMLPMAQQNFGTEKFRGRWTCLDQFFVSPAMLPSTHAQIVGLDYLVEPDNAFLGTRPKRTYQGFRYQKDGFSDHLPILLQWTPSHQ